MAATTQLTDFSDLYTDLQNRARLQTGVASTENQAKRYINISLQDMHIGTREAMPWAERIGDLTTHPEYTTGTLVATQGSATITGTGTAWNTANTFGENNFRAGGKIVIDGGKEVYEISTIASDTSAALTSVFIKATTTASTYVYFEDEYALHADFLRPVSFTSFDVSDEISLIGRSEFRRRYPRNKVPGRPVVGTILDRAFSGDTTPVRKILFYKPPDEAFLIRYPYITSKLAISSTGTPQDNMSADADEPIVPLAYRHVIVLHAMAFWYRDKKDDQRSQEAKAEYQQALARIVGDQEIGRSQPRFQPILGPYRQSARNPYRRRGRGRFATGDAFDELRD